MRWYPKVPEMPLPYVYHLPKFLFTQIPFELAPFGIDTAIPAGFPWPEALFEVISLQRLHHVLQYGLDLINAVKTSSLELQFHLREQEKITGGEVRWVGRWGMTVDFVEAKNCCTKCDAWAGALSWFRAQELLRHCLEVCAGYFDLTGHRNS
jgi:hypothetical protein